MITICYIILTCEKYLPSRATWLRKHSLKYVNQKDCYFLSCKSGPNSVYGWNTADDYVSCPWKYIEFFKNMDLNYDWYVFLDDDSFVFPNRYRENLSKLDCSKNLYVGLQYNYGGVFYMSGGATFSLSKGTYELVKNYIRNTNMINIQNTNQVMIHGDYSMGQWIYNINSSIGDNTNKISQLNLPFLLSPNYHKNDDELQNSSSFHYLNCEEQYIFYGKLVSM